MTTVVRRIVSGQKARFKDPVLSLDLDLVYVTDNIIIMGFPASGVASLYRNSRSSVRKFLDHRHEDMYRIYNFCPKTENSYDDDYFYGRVSRYPFPDHHVPPLSMIPLFVADMTEWLESDPDNVAVIHCKAGKGRSGTMTCCYLISLPYLPSAPTNLRNYSELRRPAAAVEADGEGEANGRYWEASRRPHHQRVPTDSSEVSSPGIHSPPTALDVPENPQAEELAAKLQAVFALHTSRRMKQPSAPGSSQTFGKSTASFARSTASVLSPSHADLSDARLGAGTPRKRTLGATPVGRSCDALHLTSLEPPSRGYESRVSLSNPGFGSGGPDLTRSQSSCALNQNTEDHSNVKEPKMGVSIPSQRRWVGYWARMLAGQDARIAIAHPYSTPPRRKVRITRITIDRGVSTDVKTAAGLTNRIVPHADSLSIQLARYPDSMVDRLEKWERGARRRNRAFGRHDPSLLACDLDAETQKQKDYLKNLRCNGQNLRCWDGSRYQHKSDGADAVGRWGVNVNAEADTARNFEWNDDSGESENDLQYFSLVPERERTLIGGGSESDDGLEPDRAGGGEQLWRYSFLPQGQDGKGRKHSEASCDSGYMSAQSPEGETAAAAAATSSSETARKTRASMSAEREPSSARSTNSYLDAKRGGSSSLSPSKMPSLLRRASSTLMRSVSRSGIKKDFKAAALMEPMPTSSAAAAAAANGGGSVGGGTERVTTPPSSTGYVPPDPLAGHGVGQVLDADREVMVRILVGRTGGKHSKLPDFTAVGWVWLIPSFEDPTAALSSSSSSSQRRGSRPKVGSRTVVRFGKDEIDFRKDPIGVVGVEIEWEWIEVGGEDEDDDEEEEEEAEELRTEEGGEGAQRLRSLFEGTGAGTGAVRG